jgi:hypothetical protein
MDLQQLRNQYTLLHIMEQWYAKENESLHEIVKKVKKEFYKQQVELKELKSSLARQQDMTRMAVQELHLQRNRGDTFCEILHDIFTDDIGYRNTYSEIVRFGDLEYDGDDEETDSLASDDSFMNMFEGDEARINVIDLSEQ